MRGFVVRWRPGANRECETCGYGSSSVSANSPIRVGAASGPAATGLGTRTPTDERLTIVLAPGENAYPLISYEYAIVSTKQSDPAIADAVRRFLTWSIVPSETNEGYLDTVHFIPLPTQIWALSEAQIQSIK